MLEPALRVGLLTPPRWLTDRSPSFGASLAKTNISETWVCDERGRPVGRASRGRETRAERLAPSACSMPPTARPTSPRAIPRADLLAARPSRQKSKVRNFKTRREGRVPRLLPTRGTPRWNIGLVTPPMPHRSTHLFRPRSYHRARARFPRGPVRTARQPVTRNPRRPGWSGRTGRSTGRSWDTRPA